MFPTITPTPLGLNPLNPGLRGIAPISYQIGVPAQTGIVVDDFPQSTFSTLAFELADVERVEVFAGPQSTLSGRNAAGGLINFVTRAPSSTPDHRFGIEQTTDNQTRATAFMTGPLSTTLDYSLSTFYNKWDGPLINALRNNERIGGFDSYGGRLKLRWEPTDQLSTTLTGFYIYDTHKTMPIIGGQLLVAGDPKSTYDFDTLGRPLTQIYPGLNIRPANKVVYSPEDGITVNKDVGGTFRADYKGGGLGTFSSLTSYTHSSEPRTDVFIGAPRDNLFAPINDFDAHVDVNSKTFSQELRLTSPDDKPLTYLAGLVYMNTDLHFPYSRLQIFPVDWDRTFSTASYGAFIRGTYKFSSSDSLTVGTRYQYDRLGYYWKFTPLSPTDPNTTTTGSDRYGFLAGEISYKHDFNDNLNVYFTHARTETGRAIDMEDNTDAVRGPLTPLASSKVQSYEVGLKSQLFDHKLTLNADVFRTNYQHFQFTSVETGSLGSVPVIHLLSIGRVRSQGIELTTLLRATKDLHLGLNLAYINADILDYPGAGCFTRQTLATGCVNGIQNVDGVSLPFHSKLKFTATVDYSIPLSSFNVDLGGFYRYQSSQHSDVLNDPRTFMDGYGTVNVYAGLSGKDGGWNVQLFVNNLLNKLYYAELTDIDVFSAPSTVAYYDRSSFRYGGIRANYRF